MSREVNGQHRGQDALVVCLGSIVFSVRIHIYRVSKSQRSSRFCHIFLSVAYFCFFKSATRLCLSYKDFIIFNFKIKTIKYQRFTCLHAQSKNMHVWSLSLSNVASGLVGDPCGGKSRSLSHSLFMVVHSLPPFSFRVVLLFSQTGVFFLIVLICLYICLRNKYLLLLCKPCKSGRIL